MFESLVYILNLKDMDFLRSADRELCEVSIPKDSAWEIMNSFGQLESMHFIDLNKDTQVFNLVYANKIKRIDESLRRLTTVIESEAIRSGIKMKVPSDIQSLDNAMKKQSKFKHKAPEMVFDLVEEDIINQNNLILEQKVKEEQMYNNYLHFLEKKAVLNTCSDVMKFEDIHDDEENKYDVKMREGEHEFEVREQLLGSTGLKVTHQAGTVSQFEKDRLQKLIFRATRGKALTYFRDIEQPIIDYRGVKHYKSVYIVIFQQGTYLSQKLDRILDSFMGNRFQVSQETFEDDMIDTIKNLKDLKTVIKTCFSQLQTYIKTISSLEASKISKIQLYKLYLIKERVIYETLNMMRLGNKFFVGAFWIPSSNLSKLEYSVSELSDKRNIRKPQIVKRNDCDKVPPTFIRTNEFTYPFQEITDTYGVPCYKEVNPSYFGVVTFPFLFGVMFGDIGHGTLLFIFASFLVMFPRTMKTTPVGQLVPYRYLLFLMGFFAMFCGWCYNDFASIPVELLPSCYTIEETGATRQEGCVYKFGVDPTWYLSSNSLTYLNSLKMKLSVILGVAQMSLGIFMKAANAIYFEKPLDFFYEFVPQIILMWCLFGWMDFLIVVKWCTDFSQSNNETPGIVAIMISMFLKFGAIDEGTDALVVGTAFQQT